MFETVVDRPDPTSFEYLLILIVEHNHFPEQRTVIDERKNVRGFTVSAYRRVSFARDFVTAAFSLSASIYSVMLK